MIDNSAKFKTFGEKMAYHDGWVDGMKNADELRDKIDKEWRERMSKVKYGKSK